MATAEQVLDVARREIGTQETPVNRQKYGRKYGSDGVAWCQIWCWWVMQQVPGGGDLLPKSAYTPYVLDWLRDRGRTSSQPRPGALVFFNWRDGSRPWPLPQHVGFVEAVNGTSMITIEGNSQPGTAGDQSNGGGVYRRTRARSPYVVGYGYPAYATSPPAGGSPGKDWFDMATEADLRRVVAEAVWETPIPDLYTGNPDDTMPAHGALAWAAAHAAIARDLAKQARDEAAAARAEAAGLRAALAAVSAGTSDPAAVRTAAEQGVAAALQRFALQLVPRT